MGRPPLKDRSAVRSLRMQIRLTPDQAKRWGEAATKQGMKLTQWLHFTLNRAARTGN